MDGIWEKGWKFLETCSLNIFQNQYLSKFTTQMLHPTIKWAQRKDKIYIELSLRDILHDKVNLSENSIAFSCESNKQNY